MTLVADWLPRLLHAGIMARREQRKQLEILCRYSCRPALSEKPLAIFHSGRIRYKLKTPYRDVATHDVGSMCG